MILSFLGNVKLLPIVVVSLVGVVGVGGFYIKKVADKFVEMQETVKGLEINNAKLKESINKSNKAVDDIKENMVEINKFYEDVSDEFALIRLQGEELEERFKKHDVNAIALEKPELVENAVNEAQKNVNRCFEVLSGRSKLENEKNPECPLIFER